MEEDLQTLQELIKEDAWVTVNENQYGKRVAVLEEPAEGNQRGYSVTINALPESALVIKADYFPAPNGLFQNSKGECKRADYVLIAHTERGNWIVYIELKGGKGPTEKTVASQLRGSECLIAYCREVGRQFWNQVGFLSKSHYSQRFVSIRNIAISKRPSSVVPADGVHDTPEKMLKLSSPNYLQFKRLVGAA